MPSLVGRTSPIATTTISVEFVRVFVVFVSVMLLNDRVCALDFVVKTLWYTE